MPSPNRIVSPAAASPASQFEIRERWFPGCHYDLGRQRFRFLQNGVNLPERLVNYFLNPLSQVIMPNDVCADLVQKWMLERIQQNDPQQRVIQNIGGNIQGLTANMASATPAACGSGDIYGNIVDYGPFGLPGGYLFRVVSKLVPRLGFVVNLLTRARDREIDPGAELTRYTVPCKLLGERTVGYVGGINDQRYPSQTYQNFINIPTSQLNPANPRSSACWKKNLTTIFCFHNKSLLTMIRQGSEKGYGLLHLSAYISLQGSIKNPSFFLTNSPLLCSFISHGLLLFFIGREKERERGKWVKVISDWGTRAENRVYIS